MGSARPKEAKYPTGQEEKMAKAKERRPNQRKEQASRRVIRDEVLCEAGEFGQRAKELTQERVLELFMRNGVVLGNSRRIARLVGRTPEAVQPVLEKLVAEGIVEEHSPGLYMSAREARGSSTHTPSETIS